jgi:hypothetical protein
MTKSVELSLVLIGSVGFVWRDVQKMAASYMLIE